MTLIIAEISGNHMGHLEKAVALIEAAAQAGAGAVKFQLYKPEDLHDPANNQIYEKYHVPAAWLGPMFDCAKRAHVDLFASVFAPWAVDELKKFKPKYYKIASPESTRLPDYVPVITAIRKTKKPIIWSSGKDRRWVEFNDGDSLLYCKQGYPATLDIEDFFYIREYGGFSDHTVGITSAVAAIGLGVHEIEKHFKIDDDCIDTAFSINPKELKALCDLCS